MLLTAHRSMEKLNRITAPAGEKFRQLQKIVSEIKKNDSGLFQKFKNIKSKPTPPTVPRRDYQTGSPNGEDDEWGDDFGSDYDSPDEQSDAEQYAVPTDEADDGSYEPPPNDKHVTPSFKVVMANNGYADKQKTDPMNMHMRPPPKPHEPFSKHQLPPPPVTNRMHTANRPLPKPRHPPTSMPPPVLRKPASMPPQPDCDDEENYIVPESESYIEPTKELVKKPPAVNRQNKPMPPTPIRSPTMQPPETEDELYVVPENETTPSPPQRGLLPKVTPPSYLDQDEYEVCEDLPEVPIKPKPSPSPRNVRPKPPTNFLQKPNMVPVLPQRDINSNIDKPQFMQRQRIHSAGNEPPPVPPMPHKLALPLPKPNVITIQKPPEVATRYIPGPSRHGSTVEQDADVLNKEWYVSSCDRRKAEDALTASSKDGSFLVRKSSGQDSKQPFTLVVFYNRRVYNIPVRYIEATRQYALGREKSGEEKFHSVAEMIENHRQTPLVLIDSQNNTKDSTRLKQAVRIS